MEPRRNLFGEVVVRPKLIDRETLACVIEEYVKTWDEAILVGILTNPVENCFEFARLCRGENCGKMISLFFNPHRVSTRCSQRSVADLHSIPSFPSNLSRAILFQGFSTNTSLRNVLIPCLERGVSHDTGLITDFPPRVAMQIYQTVSHCRTQLQILDPCAGWGGRMIGAAAVGASYTAFEPSTKTYNGLCKLGAWLEKFKTGFSFKLYHKPYEDHKDYDTKYDIALTSPPYFDTERYSTDPTQSYIRYATFETWTQGFFRPLIINTMRRLRPKRRFVLNIGNRKYPLTNALLDIWPTAREIPSKLSGKGGLRHVEGQERFYSLTN